jgi:protein phosphatase 2C family protein 2/3
MKLDQNQILSGPSRVFPGRLSVCRSFGDIEAKSEKHGGNPKVLIAEPEVNIIKLTEEHDYILIGCDGIFDQLSNSEILEAINLTFEKMNKDSNIHNHAGIAIDMIMKTALSRRALDNITSVFIGFDSWEKRINDYQSHFINYEKSSLHRDNKSSSHKEIESMIQNQPANIQKKVVSKDSKWNSSQQYATNIGFRSNSSSKYKVNKIF